MHRQDVDLPTRRTGRYQYKSLRQIRHMTPLEYAAKTFTLTFSVTTRVCMNPPILDYPADSGSPYPDQPPQHAKIVSFCY
jgi:hypothetical protein